MVAGRLKLLQFTDRLLGPWLCRQLTPRATELKSAAEIAGGAQRCRPIAPHEVQRILVIRPGGLGDAALTYPMLKALRHGFPKAGLDVLAEKRNAGVYEIADIVSAVHRYDAGSLATLRRLRRTRYDLIIDTEQFHHFSTIVANFLRPRYLCGFDTLGRGRFQTHPVPYSEKTYEVYSFLRLVEAVLGSSCDFDPNQTFIAVAPEAQSWAANVIHSAETQNIVAVTPTASGSSRLWPATRYAEVVRWLTQSGFFVVLLGGRDGIEAANQIISHSDREKVLNLVGQTSLAQTAGVLQQARLSISADTGVLHLAYGVGTPTVSLFGSGLHMKWGPPGQRHRIVRKKLPCSPCVKFGRLPPCPHDFACMQQISVSDVITTVRDLVDDWPGVDSAPDWL